MKKLFTMLVLALSGLSASAGSDIEKIAMSSTSIANFRQLNESSPNSTCVVVQNGCYTRDTNFPILNLGPNQNFGNTMAFAGAGPASLNQPREREMTTPQDQLVSSILMQLYPDAWATIRSYPDFIVQNFSWDTSQAYSGRSGRGFVVEVDFRLTRKGELQAIAIFGEVYGLGRTDMSVNISSYSDLNEQQEKNRQSLKTLENVLKNPDFQSPMAQVQWQDFKRAQAVGSTIAAWVSAMRFMPETATHQVSVVDIK